MKCEVCGKENSDSALFCAECGKALKEAPISLDLNQIKVPASGRKAHIVKVSAKASEQDNRAQKETAAQAVQEDTQMQEQVSPAPQAAETAAPSEEPQVQALPKADEEGLIDLSGAPVHEPSPAPAKAETTDVPMKIRNWVVVFVLSMIPFVNLVFLFVWSFSKKTNKSKKSYAQTMLIFTAIGIVLGVAAMFACAALFHVDYQTVLGRFAAP